jgi:hypothetical protein
MANGYLHSLKTPGPMTMEFQNCGVVALPSFHTVLAVLAAVARWPIRRLRWIVGLVTGGTIASTVTALTTGTIVLTYWVELQWL